MSLVTRCPRCKTLFRVVPAQLQARAGQVRCGRCMNVFDGFQALAVEQSTAAEEPGRVEPESAVAAAVAAATAARAADAPPAPADVRQKTRVADMPPAGESPLIPDAAPSTRAPSVWTSLRRAPTGEMPKRPPSPKTKWVSACVLLGVLLAFQVAYAFRSDLAARHPALRSVLSDLCAAVGCAVSLPQRPHLVRIEASDVHMTDATRPSLIQVTATLRSYASYDLAYPALDLVLTNANEHALARRIFVPADYLDRTRDPRAGIPPRGEFTVALDLDTGDLNAAGFRLDLMAAPAP